jgi:branched-chain amino acid transport system substrate-binding protein
MVKGVEMAVADINARGGVLGKKLRLVSWRLDPKQAVAVARYGKGKLLWLWGHASSIPASAIGSRGNFAISLQPILP